MVKRAERIGYFDFYAGPGRYAAGRRSTPLLIMERAIASNDLSSRLVTIFNDANPDYTSSLESEIKGLAGIERLKYQPQVVTGEVNDDLAQQFEEIKTIPSLSFVDPWGYRGLSLRLIRAVIKDWGCEVIFFFNYNRINMGINNNLVEPHMQALLGQQRLKEVRADMASLRPDARESRLMRATGEALEEMGAPYLIPFRFRRREGRVSHYICFVTKHPLGYSIMKEIMASRGVVDDDAVPRFEYMPRTAGMQLAFDRPRPIVALPQQLCAAFVGQTLTLKEVYARHNVGTPFIKRNYKKVLIEMERARQIACDPNYDSRKPGTIADHVLVTFP